MKRKKEEKSMDTYFTLFSFSYKEACFVYTSFFFSFCKKTKKKVQ